MLSYNQGSGTNNAYMEGWANAQQSWAVNTGSEMNNQIQQWPQQQNVWQPVHTQNCMQQPAANYFQSQQNFTSYQTNQMTQVPASQQQLYYSIARQPQLPPAQSKVQKTSQARITLIPNSTGGFKAIVKRKRKRTMFTTEQVEALESVFKRKPYISREDRQVLVDQLQITDTSIKVWFQNRRLRGKRELEQAIEEASEMYEDLPSEESSYSFPSSMQSSPDVSMIYSPIAHLDHIESELTQKADESGYITLDEKAIGDIVNAIDMVLSPNININYPVTSPEETTNGAEDAVDSDCSTSAGSVYEPISPAGSDSADEEAPRWEGTAPDQSLQRLFDLHFC